MYFRVNELKKIIKLGNKPSVILIKYIPHENTTLFSL